MADKRDITSMSASIADEKRKRKPVKRYRNVNFRGDSYLR